MPVVLTDEEYKKLVAQQGGGQPNPTMQAGEDLGAALGIQNSMLPYVDKAKSFITGKPSVSPGNDLPQDGGITGTQPPYVDPTSGMNVNPASATGTGEDTNVGSNTDAILQSTKSAKSNSMKDLGKTGTTVGGAAIGSFAGPVGTVVGAEVGSAVGGEIFGEDDDGGESEKSQKAQRKNLEEKTRQNKLQRKALTPLGDTYDQQMQILSYGGPVSRVLPLSDKAMKKLGMKPLTKQQKIINIIRPPTPEYNFANAEKAQGMALGIQSANKFLTALTMYGSMLNSLSGLSRSHLENIG